MVRVAQHDNSSKYESGRFLMLGKIVGLCENDSYVVQYEDTGKMAKKRLSDLKVVEANRLEGDVDPYKKKITEIYIDDFVLIITQTPFSNI